jgi:DNA mismatch endonuclease (patch repair protein)
MVDNLAGRTDDSGIASVACRTRLRRVTSLSVGQHVREADAMTDRPVPSSPGVSERMSRARRRDTDPEMQIRREAHRRGLRYRVDAPLPGMPRRRADMVFPTRKVAVFVDGCFWHSCPEHVSIPRANREWWLAKLRKNRERDGETDAHLHALGWVVLRFWEHEDPVVVVDVVERVVRDHSSS